MKNRKLNLELGLYHVQDREFVDYNYQFCEKVDEFIRDSIPDFNRPYFSCLGAEYTLGRRVKNSYPSLLSEKLNIQALNLGRGGVGPEYYLQRPQLLAAVNQSEFVILEVMGADSVSNSIFKNENGINCFTSPLREGRHPARTNWKDLFSQSSREQFLSYVIEQRSTWLDKMLALISKIEKPVILLYFGDVPPRQNLDLSNFEKLWQPPALIDQSVVELIASKTDSHFVYCTELDLPKELEGMTDCPSQKSREDNSDSQEQITNYLSSNFDETLIANLRKLIEHDVLKKKKEPSEKLVNLFSDLLQPWAHPNILNFIKNLNRRDMLIFDAPESESWLDSINPECYVSTPNSWVEVVKRNDVSRIIIASSKNEAEIKFKVKEYILSNCLNINVKGIYSDIIYNRSFRVSNVNKSLNSPLPNLKYIVLCTPRSGSTVLCDLLEKTSKAGFPKEHLTRPVYEALKAGAFQFSDWYNTLQKNAISKNLVFGTKIITERLEWLRNIYSDSQLRMSFDKHKVIRLTRGSVAEQAVSKWFAQVSNKWHVKNIAEEDNTFQFVKNYNFDAIYKIYISLIDDEQKLEKQITDIFGKEVIEVEYSCLVTDTKNEMNRVTEFLGIDINIEDLSLKSDFRRHNTEAKNKILELFTKTLQEI
jgi:LPS sulfotransferase NodH